MQDGCALWPEMDDLGKIPLQAVNELPIAGSILMDKGILLGNHFGLGQPRVPWLALD